MCDLAKERERINAILEWAGRQRPVRDSVDENELTDFVLAVLQENYADKCPECMREVCRDFATRLARRQVKGSASTLSNETALRAHEAIRDDCLVEETRPGRAGEAAWSDRFARSDKERGSKVAIEIQCRQSLFGEFAI